MRLSFALPVLALLLSLTSSARAAEWSGTIEMKVTTPQGSGGTMVVAVGAGGALSTMTMQTPMGTMTQKTLLQKDKPDTIFLLNDAEKTYSVIDVKELKAKAEAMGVHPDQNYTVKKLGTETVAGFVCQHVQATGADGHAMELWTTRDLLDGATFARVFGKNGPVNGGLMKALADAGVDGFVARLRQQTPQGPVTMELVRVEKSTPPASSFSLPAGYAKSDLPPGMGSLPPEARKQMMEQLKNMTPEQREMMQKALSGH
jgi:hypothetical protein